MRGALFASAPERFANRPLASNRSITIKIFSAAIVGLFTVSVCFIHTTSKYFDQLFTNLQGTNYNYFLVPRDGRHRIDVETDHNNGEEDMRVCHGIKSLLNISQWPDIVFYEDRPDFLAAPNPDREENVVARATVAEFNRLRKSVLTTSLLDDGISEGSVYAAQSFAQRFLDGGKSSRPLSIAVTGNSFTIGSNCGENESHDSGKCAWPNRLAQRWKEIITKAFGNTTNSEIEWHMLQANAQASNNE